MIQSETLVAIGKIFAVLKRRSLATEFVSWSMRAIALFR
jgi:hypothetical protein